MKRLFGTLIPVVVMLLGVVRPTRAQTPPCCSVMAIDARTGTISAKETVTGRNFQFRVANALQLRGLHVGSPVYANFSASQVSLDGKTACCVITSMSPVPAPAPVRPAAVPTPARAPAAAPPPSSTPATGSSVATVFNIQPRGIVSPPSENAKGEPDPAPHAVGHVVAAVSTLGPHQQRLAETDQGKQIIQQGVKLLGGITMHASLLGGHKYMINNCLGIKASAGNFDLLIPDPDVRFENTAARMSFTIDRISMNALSVRLRPDLGDPTNACSFSGRIGIGGYAENIRYDITFDPILDLQSCRLGSMGKVDFKYSVGKVRLEPLPPEVGNLAKDLINDALLLIYSNTNFNLVDEEMLAINRLLAQKCPAPHLSY